MEQVVEWHLCAFRAFFGIDCPGCGLLRSLFLILKGSLGESVAMHPMGVLIFLWLANIAWLKKIHFSAAVLKGISFSILFGFFGQWIFKFFV